MNDPRLETIDPEDFKYCTVVQLSNRQNIVLAAESMIELQAAYKLVTGNNPVFDKNQVQHVRLTRR